MRYVIAVSGGVDSVVLLHKMVQAGLTDSVVAHFDHGIRDDSAADARFVGGLAAMYDLPYRMSREVLGANASESEGRSRRHAFLTSVSESTGGKIVTAHHLDDVVETVAINLTRGTGWRGLSIMGGERIVRPLLGLTKRDIYAYARENRLEWVEDSTNASDVYLRNRLRRKLGRNVTEDQKRQLLDLWRSQLVLREEIESEEDMFVSEEGEYSRYFFTSIDFHVACDLLHRVVERQNYVSPTRPQLERAVLAIRAAKPGTTIDMGAGCRLFMYERTYIVR